MTTLATGGPVIGPAPLLVGETGCDFIVPMSWAVKGWKALDAANEEADVD